MLTNEELNQVRKRHNDAKARAVANNATSTTITKEVLSMQHKDDGQDDVTVEHKARADFNSSVAIREEFENVDRYIAFRKAEARGRMKILGGVVRGGI